MLRALVHTLTVWWRATWRRADPFGPRESRESAVGFFQEAVDVVRGLGLLEIPLCLYQDRSYFDVDMGGDSTASVDQWVAYLKRGVDFAAAQGLVLSLTLHPSTSFKHDPKARYLDEVLAYCRQRSDVRVGTYGDIHARGAGALAGTEPTGRST